MGADRNTLCTMRHTRGLGYCNKGVREWLKGYGIDWTTFVRVGVPAHLLLDTQDEMAIKVAEAAMEEQNGRRR